MSDPAVRSDVLLLRSGHGALDGALAAAVELRAGAQARALDALPGELPPGGVVLDASAAPAADVERALEGGLHWVCVDGSRARVLGAAEAWGPAAEAGGARAVSGAGMLPGLVEPFVRETADGLRRVNEVLVAVAPGAERFGVFDSAALVGSLGSTIPMLLGAEQTEREALGDERWFEHPAPTGALRSVNVDTADLELYTSRPIKATSVRVSFSQATGAERKLLQRAAKFAPKGWFGGAAGSASRLDGLAAKLPATALLTVIVRGIDAQQLPRERRIGIAAPAGAASLAAVPASLVVADLLAGRAPDDAGPAGPVSDWIAEARLLEALAEAGAKVVEGDLGGWRGSH